MTQAGHCRKVWWEWRITRPFLIPSDNIEGIHIIRFRVVMSSEHERERRGPGVGSETKRSHQC